MPLEDASVIPVLIISSMVIATLWATSPKKASPLTTPSVQYFSLNALSIGRCRA